MKTLLTLLFLALLAFAGWPYLNLYRLDRALVADDAATLEELVDMEAVRQEVKNNLVRDVQHLVPVPAAPNGPMMQWLQNGLRRFGDQAVEQAIDRVWVRTTLLRSSSAPLEESSFLDQVTYAFFESYDRFLVRVGELGAGPVHVRMTLAHGRWRVTAIYI